MLSRNTNDERLKIMKRRKYLDEHAVDAVTVNNIAMKIKCDWQSGAMRDRFNNSDRPNN